MKIVVMAFNNPGTWIWLDIHTKNWYYVFIFPKYSAPYLYRSRDATPPKMSNEGRWYFGSRSRGG